MPKESVQSLLDRYVSSTHGISTASLVRRLIEDHGMSVRDVVKVVSMAREDIQLPPIDAADVEWHLRNRMTSSEAKEILQTLGIKEEIGEQECGNEVQQSDSGGSGRDGGDRAEPGSPG